MRRTIKKRRMIKGARLRKTFRPIYRKTKGGTKSSEERKHRIKVGEPTKKKRGRPRKLVIVESLSKVQKAPSPSIAVSAKMSPINEKQDIKTKKEEIAEMKMSAPMPMPMPMEMILEETKEKKRWNEDFIDLLDKLANLMLKQGEAFRARAYQKAQETLMTYPEDITDPAQLKGLPAIGSTILEKLNEYVKTGTLRVLEREKNNPIYVLGEIYGVGPKKAKELVEAGITTLDQLRSRQELLNDIQRVGLKYYEDILQRIPRAEIDQYKHIFEEAFHRVEVPGSHMEIVGSYRRGAANSGDIDVIITTPKPEVFGLFIDNLKKAGIILPDGILSFGQSKALVVAKLPGAEFARRVDFLNTSPEEYPFAVLYFTGSKIFNTVMRSHALNMGYSLNEHGIYKMEGKKKGEKVARVFSGEKDIFDFLELRYQEPRDRVNGLAVLSGPSGSLPEGSALVLAPSLTLVPKTEKKEKREKTTTLKKGKPGIVSKKLISKPKLMLTTVKEESALEKDGEKEGKEDKETEAVKSQVKEYITAFKKHGISVLDALTEDQLISILSEADAAFHLNKTPIMTDNEYDIIKDYGSSKYPDNLYFLEVGTTVERNKVKLPYTMASMDKIKPDTGALGSWKTKYPGPYVLSCKLDGVSGMYSTEGKEPKLYTRGNGHIGQDISYLIPYLRLPKKKGIVVRGEFIIPKAIFEAKYRASFANPRNLVAGVVNRVSIDKEKIGDIHFVAYEMIRPEVKPSVQMEHLIADGFETVLYKVESTITNELLSETLVDWRAHYVYEIDGVIVADDKIYPRKESGNPDHAFAFKMVLSDQMAEAKVVNVLWTPSKDGYLKPRVQIEPVHLGGVTIEYATGFNAAFIQENKIGVGALVQMIRSGDVIPYIRAVTVPATEPMMPNIPYKWNKTHVDIMLEDAKSDATVREKNITGFFRGIGVEGLSSGNVARIIAAGYDNIPAILKMTVADLEKVEGFKTKTATKIYQGIQEKVASASLVSLMAASNLFGRGFSDKKLELIMEAYPNVFTETISDSEKVAKIAAIKGMATKTAEAFVQRMAEFQEFLVACGLESKMETVGSLIVVDMGHPLYKKSVVLTGTRDKELMAALKAVGAVLGSSVSKNTFAVIAPSLEEDTGKAEDARRLGVPLYTPSTFRTAFAI